MSTRAHQRWWEAYRGHPWGLTAAAILLCGIVFSRVGPVWTRAGFDLRIWSEAFIGWLSSSEAIAFLIAFLIFAVYDRLCLVGTQLHELIVVKALICEDNDGHFSVPFFHLLAGHGLGPLAKRRE
jgi:hypothetical protein